MKLKSLTIIATLCSVALSGCMMNAQGQQQISRTALIGGGAALTCGIIGGIAKGSKGAGVGALACGAIGAGIGGYMDYQEVKLREQLANTGVEVQRQGNQIKLTMPENITFATNSAVLSPQAQTALSQAAQTLATYNETTLSIVGHTDSSGNDSINNPLSYNRAKAVANYLQQYGVAPNRMYVSGQGSRQPIADNLTFEGKARNRRVEILIKPNPNVATH
ncbi:MAG: OmpA family protein [Alysiella sp.]|uniref:OmpA family protein n=1 Tax=Alysiella sp. TaxID=1872483 RepID=UPI0026DD97F8|nr:OmpA family protein [Alysiella sp.]MDO4434151.1 OmpA family protein [Alysiella sp.]